LCGHVRLSPDASVTGAAIGPDTEKSDQPCPGLRRSGPGVGEAGSGGPASPSRNRRARSPRARSTSSRRFSRSSIFASTSLRRSRERSDGVFGITFL
jgi:hypothetical protein